MLLFLKQTYIQEVFFGGSVFEIIALLNSIKKIDKKCKNFILQFINF